MRVCVCVCVCSLQMVLVWIIDELIDLLVNIWKSANHNPVITHWNADDLIRFNFSDEREGNAIDSVFYINGSVSVLRLHKGLLADVIIYNVADADSLIVFTCMK